LKKTELYQLNYGEIMDKTVLLKSIKSVCGFLAVFFFAIFGCLWLLQNYPMVAVPVLIVLILVYMIRYEYKSRIEKQQWNRFKDGIK
jgi:uncharacterized membrane protein